jgi:hypothetical protein
MKPLAISLSGTGRGWQKWGDRGGDLTNVQCKAIQNCHKTYPTPYNEYMLIKMKKIILEATYGSAVFCNGSQN